MQGPTRDEHRCQQGPDMLLTTCFGRAFKLGCCDIEQSNNLWHNVDYLIPIDHLSDSPIDGQCANPPDVFFPVLGDMLSTGLVVHGNRTYRTV